ncbi:MAG: hypothetical protein GY784_06285 [Gammaproteobacteria bacterium]|nr:hypothetical protein [Gammaproteobacteria bacterium]
MASTTPSTLLVESSQESIDKAGFVMLFMQKSWNCHDNKSCGKALLDILSSHDLIATLMICVNDEDFFMSSYCEPDKLDKSILQDCREKGRVVECDSSIIYNGSHCALEIHGIPTHYKNKHDQLNSDLLAMLNSMDARLTVIASEGNIFEKQASMLKTIDDTRSTLTLLDATNRQQQLDHAAMLSDLGENLESALFELGLTDEQEEFLASILEETRVIGDALYKTADDLDAQLQLIISALTEQESC